MRESDLSAQLVDVTVSRTNLQMTYPRVEELPNQAVQKHINQQIQSLVDNLVTNPENLHPAYQPGTTEITLTYKLEANTNGVLSLYFEVYSFPEHAANGRTVASSLNFSLENGHNYKLHELFKPGSEYVNRINAIIVKEFKVKDLPQIEEFESIDPDQEYYLTEKALEIYFQEVEYTPHYVGVPVFDIPYPAVSDLTNPRGLIAQITGAYGPLKEKPAIKIRYS